MPGGGPGNPMAFGKSKAKFQMEPNTGITFADVAGVDEAKQDFEEVGAVQRGAMYGVDGSITGKKCAVFLSSCSSPSFPAPPRYRLWSS